MGYLVTTQMRYSKTSCWVLQASGRWCSRAKIDFSSNPIPIFPEMKVFAARKEAEEAMEKIGVTKRVNQEDPDDGPLVIVEIPDGVKVQ